MKHQDIAVDRLSHFHKNPRRGNVDLLVQSLEAHGQFKPIVVNEGTMTGRPLEVLAGNHLLEAAQRLGWKKIAAVLVDVDDARASKIVLADNKTADSGGYDLAILDELLADLVTDVDDLLGTGYTDLDYLDSLSRLEALLTDPEADLAPEPDEDTGNPSPPVAQPVIQTTLIFDDVGQQRRWYAFVKHLRDNYDGDSITARLDSYLVANIEGLPE